MIGEAVNGKICIHKKFSSQSPKNSTSIWPDTGPCPEKADEDGLNDYMKRKVGPAWRKADIKPSRLRMNSCLGAGSESAYPHSPTLAAATREIRLLRVMRGSGHVSPPAPIHCICSAHTWEENPRRHARTSTTAGPDRCPLRIPCAIRAPFSGFRTHSRQSGQDVEARSDLASARLPSAALHRRHVRPAATRARSRFPPRETPPAMLPTPGFAPR